MFYLQAVEEFQVYRYPPSSVDRELTTIGQFVVGMIIMLVMLSSS